MSDGTLPFGKDAKPDYLEVQDRRPLTKWEFATLFLKQEGKCAVCGSRLERGKVRDEHLHALNLGGGNELTNRALWCLDCTKPKDATDKAAIAKGKRLRKETGNGPRRKIQSRGFKKHHLETHGMRRTSEYRIWAGMKNRCQSQTSPDYPSYGGRGIQLCARWAQFENFFADMGPRPSTEHSIDRINNDGPYAPDNCRWATHLEQCRNLRTNRMVTFRGETLCVRDWSVRLGIPGSTLTRRLKEGWPIDEAMRTERHGPHVIKRKIQQRNTFDRPSLLFKLARSESPSKWGRAGAPKRSWPKGRKFMGSSRLKKGQA